MDPVSALGLAANIAQFVQFAGSLLGQGWALYKDGETASHQDVTLVTRDLQTIAQKLAVNHSLAHGGAASWGDEQSLDKLCKRCEELSEELLSIVKSLSVSGPGQKWQSFRQAMRTAGKKSKLETLEKSLNDLRDQMNSHMLLILGYDSLLICIDTS